MGSSTDRQSAESFYHGAVLPDEFVHTIGTLGLTQSAVSQSDPRTFSCISHKPVSGPRGNAEGLKDCRVGGGAREALASVRRPNCTYGFPVCSFHEDSATPGCKRRN